MIQLEINEKNITVPEGTTVLEAARRLHIKIPTMCYMDGYEPFTSCMVCVVHDLESDRLIPACSAPVSAGMRIATGDEPVRDARKDTLDLLLSDHVGNCEAPCVRACAAYMNIPLMIHYIRQKRYDTAIRIVKHNIALPAVLGRICPAPCEKVCNRKELDDSLAICLLKRYVADVDLASQSPFMPDLKPASGKKVAIVGAGPAGLAAAYYLRVKGHQSDLFDANDLPGGLLRYGIPDKRLDKRVLDAELETVLLPGIQFHKSRILGKSMTLKELHSDYDAVILTTGEIQPENSYLNKIKMASGGIQVNRRTFGTSLTGIFAGGNAIIPGRLAIRSLAHGKFMSESVNQYLEGLAITGYNRKFNSKTGRISSGEAEQMVQLAGKLPRSFPDNEHNGLNAEQALNESSRCFRCDCRKAVSCKLRQYATEYEARQQRLKTGIRKNLELLVDHDLILFEPGKCIKCGLCVQITQRAGEDLGLAFINRGYNTRIDIPFDGLLKDGIKKVALECADACPTAAIALKNTFEEVEDVTR